MRSSLPNTRADGGISLLYGVTGSGKTSVFLKLIDRAVEDKRGVILMVPEISLTPQMLLCSNAGTAGRWRYSTAPFHGRAAG